MTSRDIEKAQILCSTIKTGKYFTENYIDYNYDKRQEL